MSTKSEKEISLRQLLKDLAEQKTPIRSALVYLLSEPDPDDLATLKQLWTSIAAEKRTALLNRLAETSETTFDVDFSDVALFALYDGDELVRQSAIAVLWTNEEPETMRQLIRLLEQDNSVLVRSAAAEALGPFVLNGELGDLDQSLAQEAEEALLTILKADHEPLDIQRRSLESLSYSGREEVVPLIKKAHESDLIELQASAIFAMGRSADERWNQDIIQALDDPNPVLRYEAARAAGELNLKPTVSRLIALIQEDDREIRNAAIWSLGEIGGTTAERALMQFSEEAEDEDLIEALEDALANAQVAVGFLPEATFDDEEDPLDNFEEYSDNE